VGMAFVNSSVDFWHIVFPKSGTRQAVRSSQTGALVPRGSGRIILLRFSGIFRGGFRPASTALPHINLVDHQINDHARNADVEP
jgi:hypothetical protein